MTGSDWRRLGVAYGAAVALVSAVLAGTRAAEPSRAAADALEVRVDPRVELLSIVFRLAGHPEYNQENSRSPYSVAVEEWFAAHREHSVVTEARRLRATRGVSYDAPMTLAVHLGDPPDMEERVPFEPRPARLDARWEPAEARNFAALLRDFARASRYMEFCAAHRLRYVEVEKRMQAKLGERAYREWLAKFFGARPQASFRVIPALLTGGSCFSVGVIHPNGSEEILPVIGIWKWDGDGLPLFDDGFVPTVVHEFVHSYTNPLVDAHAKALDPPAERIFRHCRPTMELQAYGSARILLYESLVRACVVRHVAATEGEEATARAIREEEERNGFEWMGALAELLARYETARARFATLGDFMPEIIRFFERYAVEYDERMAAAPHVVRTTPSNGATGVAPGPGELVIEFDRPMRRDSFSIVGKGAPEFTGKPVFDDSGKILRIPMRLFPGTSYRFSLNTLDHKGFRTPAGLPLQPTAVAFSTAYD